MSQFTNTLTDLRKALDRKFDHLMVLRNQPSVTIDHDAHYAILRLAQLVATEFPSADQMFSWTKETLSYSLPADWQRDRDPYWLVECPRLAATYDELLAAPDAQLSIGSDSPFIYTQREYKIDSLLARVTIEAPIPAADIALLRSIGKIAEDFHESYTSTHLVC